MPRRLLCSAWVIFVAVAIPSSTAAAEREQLPPGVRPVHYDLALIPDAENLTFRGRVQITIDVKASAAAVVLNADELVLDKAVLDKEAAPAAVALDGKLQRATLTFAHPVAAGIHTLTIEYHGVIGRSTQGFFAMDYDSPAGKRRTIATNFEPTAERRFMPSWDEPGLKATFSISVDGPADRMAVSNMPITSIDTLTSGQKRVHFAVTPKMSTYLLFLGVGDFERIATKVDGCEVGVVVNRGDTEKGRYALNEASRLLHYYNDYFGVPFPLPKLDLVVAPGAINGGAMENWGAILYAQRQLLFDPASSAEAARQRVFQVVSHEMAHQWFGDLVTMAWWDNLWLNEGFARWMQTRAADDLHSEWKTGLQALAIAERGKRADAKPSTHPIVQPVLTASQAEQAFDEITYDKGATVIGMLESYVGPKVFRDGIRRYMKAHAYGTTVDADLWRDVQAAAGKPVLEVESDFTKQPGLPLIQVGSARVSGGMTKVTVTEGRFVEDPATIAFAPVQRWRIPITLSAGGAAATQLLSGQEPTSFTVHGTGPVIVNAGQSGYARVRYPQAAIAALGAGIADTKPADQLGLLYDAWALGQSGYAPISNYLDLVRGVPPAAEPIVWDQIVTTLVGIDRLYGDKSGRAAFTAFARQVLQPLADRLGWNAQPNEDSNSSVTRNGILSALSEFGDDAVIAEARRRYDVAQRDPQSMSPDMRQTVRAIVARHANPATLDRLIVEFRATQNPLQKQTFLRQLSGVADEAGAQRILEIAVSPDAASGTASNLLIALSAAHPDLVWNFALQHTEELRTLVSSQMRLSLMPAIAANSSDPKRAAELLTYADQNIPSSARQSVEAAIATISQNARFRAERLPEVDAWLASERTR